MTAHRALPIAALVAVATLGACTAPGDGVTPADGIFDPYEDHNRRAHAFNRGLDKALVRPASRGYSALLPDEAETVVGNFARNFSQPSVMVNGLLQGDLETVGISFSRFFVNTVFGFGGLIDVATAFEFEEPDADFGQTLYVWGVREGAYLELPILGPATERDAFGRLVDQRSRAADPDARRDRRHARQRSHLSEPRPPQPPRRSLQPERPTRTLAA
jgi:phospholipid-binding lipoprotein MlaA